MTILSLLVLGAALQQSPQPRPAQGPQPATQQTPALSGLDSSVRAVTDVGTRVAEVRSAYDQYRRAVFNEADGAIVERATVFRTRCTALAASARLAQRNIVVTRVAPQLRTPLLRYREYLPTLAQVGDQCAARTLRLRGRGSEAAAATAMRADIRNEGNRVVAGLMPYEARLQDVRVAMGWTGGTQTPTPRRGS